MSTQIRKPVLPSKSAKRRGIVVRVPVVTTFVFQLDEKKLLIKVLLWHRFLLSFVICAATTDWSSFKRPSSQSTVHRQCTGGDDCVCYSTSTNITTISASIIAPANIGIGVPTWCATCTACTRSTWICHCCEVCFNVSDDTVCVLNTYVCSKENKEDAEKTKSEAKSEDKSEVKSENDEKAEKEYQDQMKPLLFAEVDKFVPAHVLKQADSAASSALSKFVFADYILVVTSGFFSQGMGQECL